MKSKQAFSSSFHFAPPAIGNRIAHCQGDLCASGSLSLARGYRKHLIVKKERKKEAQRDEVPEFAFMTGRACDNFSR